MIYVSQIFGAGFPPTYILMNYGWFQSWDTIPTSFFSVSMTTIDNSNFELNLMSDVAFTMNTFICCVLFFLISL